MKTELHQKLILQLSVCELQICILKKDTTGFSIAYDEKGLVHVIDAAVQLIIPPQLRNMTQCHQNMCGCKIFIQTETYQ